MPKTWSRAAIVTAVVTFAPAAVLAPANAAATPAEPVWRLADTVHYSGTTTLEDVAAAGARDVWVVGQADEIGPALARHWNGDRWKTTRLPEPLATSGRLHAAGASSAGNVWAFGTSGANEYALRWDGERWATSQIWQREGSGTVKGAIALSPSDVWAFGGDINPYDDMGTWHFDGDNWTRAETDFSLTSGSALAPTDIWAVGGQQQSDGTARPVVARWQGEQWTEVPTPEIPHEWAYPPVFTAVHAISPSDVWAVGSRVERIDGELHILPLALHWNGAGWEVIQVPGEAELTSVSSDGRGAVWVAGEVHCALLRYADGQWTCPEPPRVKDKTLNINAIARAPETARLWSVGELVWGGLPNTDGVVLTQR
jgi:hypothetical protein